MKQCIKGCDEWRSQECALCKAYLSSPKMMYKMMIHPVALYGTEYQPITNHQKCWAPFTCHRDVYNSKAMFYKQGLTDLLALPIILTQVTNAHAEDQCKDGKTWFMHTWKIFQLDCVAAFDHVKWFFIDPKSGSCGKTIEWRRTYLL